ncbi:conserved hypothetical protein [Paecilomyces variotii No. 5]|uniref:C6 zinc finger domain protein n=1 Tax=Byssochlamys spectabilis (strain No. 5 / NBRC 109023) TaxID=1356009 RepID=V5FQI4_BYSSN|nr:conserved hypothetical protein [Paecilomyces variotii No. 5]
MNVFDPPIGSGIEIVFPGLCQRDQALFHHYMTVTTLSITADIKRLDRWRSFIPSVAKEAEYSLHSLLAFSALHLAHIQRDNRRRYLSIATSHQCQALATFRSEVKSITQDNTTPIVVFSCFLILYELGLVHPNHQVCDMQDPITKFIQSVMLIHNAVKSLKQAPWLRVGPVMQLLLRSARENAPSVPPEVYQALRQLDILNETTTVDAHERQIYTDAVQHLRDCFEAVSISPEEWLPSLRWANVVSSDYVAALQEKRPMALVILVHFCLLVYHSPERWWMSGWNETIVNEAMQLLDGSWKPHILWAIESMKPDKPLLETSGKGIPGDGNITSGTVPKMSAEFSASGESSGMSVRPSRNAPLPLFPQAYVP